MTAASQPQPRQTTSDDIFAAVASLLAAVDALEEWAASQAAPEQLPLETQEPSEREEA
jgi:hypothetical protein